MNCPECQSTRLRPLLPVVTDERPAYICRDCRARFLGERRTNTAKATLKHGERRAPDKPRKLA